MAGHLHCQTSMLCTFFSLSKSVDASFPWSRINKGVSPCMYFYSGSFDRVYRTVRVKGCLSSLAGSGGSTTREIRVLTERALILEELENKKRIETKGKDKHKLVQRTGLGTHTEDVRHTESHAKACECESSIEIAGTSASFARQLSK